MDLQTVTYAIAIIFMFMWIVLVGALIGLIFMVIKIVRETPKRVEEKIVAYFSSNKLEILSTIGIPVAAFIATRIRNMIKKK